MSSYNLNTLPADVLFLVSQYLDASTLRSLALVDKQTNVAARNSLFQSITIKTPDLPTDTQEWRSILQRNSAWQAVRRLRIGGGHGYAISHLVSDQEEIDFTPLLELVSRLSALTRITWVCMQQFPEPLLRTVEQRFPSCRLHLEIFRLRSIFDPSQEAYEQALLSSPVLYAINAPTDGRRHEQAEKILRHIVGLAPNLRSLERSARGSSIMISPKGATPPPKEHAWLESPNSQGQLENLEFMTVLNTTTLARWTAVTDWSRLRSLNLSAGWGPEPDPQVFDHLSTKCSFENLDRLEIQIPATGSDEVEAALALGARQFLCGLRPLLELRISGDVDSTLLRPVLERHGSRLRRLDISPLVGILGRSVAQDAVYLNNATSDADELAEDLFPCLKLEELALPIPRTRGNKDEVALYRVIGASLPRLQRIDIELDATDPAFYREYDRFEEDEQPSHPDFDAYDNEFLDDWAPEEGVGPRKGHIRHAFINSAIDEKLVRSIFWLINEAKPKEGSLLLEEAFFTVKPGGYTGDGVTSSGISDLCQIMDQDWVVRRSPRDDRRQEVDAVAWDGTGSKLKNTHYSTAPDEEGIVEEWSTIGPIFRKLWPSNLSSQDGDDEDPGNWREDWHSFPLEI